MYCIEIPKGIHYIMSFFYYLGLWHRGDKPTARETRIKFFYCFYHLLFPISLIVGAITSENKDEKIFLTEVGIVAAVLSMKLFYIVYRKDHIIEMLSRNGVYSFENHDKFMLVNDKLKRFMKFVIVLYSFALIGAYASAAVPFFMKEKMLFLNIGFPLDWKNNETAFWLANVFIFTEVTLTMIALLFSVIIWYLMISCVLRYEILGCQLRNMGTTHKKAGKIQVEKQNLFLRDLTAGIDSHQHIREIINQMVLNLSDIFFVQIVTSGLGICFSTYCLAFNVGETLVEHLIHLTTLVYNLYDIFMIMYFGNEIKLSSDQLSYCLFESNWIDQPQATKKYIIIFGELLKQPHEIVIGTMYPLTLATFTRVLNFAYNTFNILKNIK